MNFRFKLEALRQYRCFQEEKQQKEMAEAQRARDHQSDKLAALIDLRKKTESDLKSRQTGRITGPHLAIYNNYLNQLDSDIFAQKHKLSDAEKLLKNKREALLTAMQKRKTLDKLKEKGLKDHIEHLDSEEEKFINEMAISRYTINQR